jgi:hypothetical protein
MSERTKPLFAKEHLQSLLNGIMETISSRVDAVPEDQFCAASENDLVEHLLPRFLITPLVLHEENREMQQSEAMVDISGDFSRDTRRGQMRAIKGIRIDVSAPFSGGYTLWDYAPNQSFGREPRGFIMPSPEGDSGTLHIIKEQPNDVPMERLKPEIESEFSMIRAYLGFQKEQIEKHNSSVPNQLLRAIQGRKKRLEIHKAVPNILGIPLKRKEGAPNFEPIGIKRKLPRPLPAMPKPGHQPEPGISEPEYQHILAVIRHEGMTFETTPRTYAVHDEEELRDIVLAHLNGHYEGAASGEAFRKFGKTDIKIEDRDRAAFIGECKIWRGSKELAMAIDQMLGYLTWRDCKAALVIFNKDNAKFSEILTKIPEALKSHPKFKSEIATMGRGEWKIQLSSSEDENRLITVTVFAFNLFFQVNATKGT